MIDHSYLPISDLNRSSEFDRKVLGPLGIDLPCEIQLRWQELPAKK